MPRPGDLIEIDRQMYNHWAIYIGNGYVIHIVPPSEVAGAGAYSLMSVMHKRATVRQDLLKDVAGTDPFRVNNLLDDEYVPRDIDEMLIEAKSMVGCVLPYDVIFSNCEHFVTNLRYGKPESRQVRNAMIGLAGVAFGAFALMAILGNGRKEKKNSEEYHTRYY